MPPIDPGDDWDDDSDLRALVYPASVDDEDANEDDDANFSILGNIEPGDDPDPRVPVVQVTSPDGALAVTAYLNGSIARVDLSPNVTRWTERELAAAITELADVAAKRATAVVHVMVVEMMVAQGVDLNGARDFVGTHLPFATPAQADAALEELSVRYANQAR